MKNLTQLRLVVLAMCMTCAYPVFAQSIFSERQKSLESSGNGSSHFLDDFISATPKKVTKQKRWEKFKSYEEYGITPSTVPAENSNVRPPAPPPPGDYYRQKDPFAGDRLRYVEDSFRPEEGQPVPDQRKY